MEEEDPQSAAQPEEEEEEETAVVEEVVDEQPGDDGEQRVSSDGINATEETAGEGPDNGGGGSNSGIQEGVDEEPNGSGEENKIENNEADAGTVVTNVESVVERVSNEDNDIEGSTQRESFGKEDGIEEFRNEESRRESIVNYGDEGESTKNQEQLDGVQVQEETKAGDNAMDGSQFITKDAPSSSPKPKPDVDEFIELPLPPSIAIGQDDDTGHRQSNSRRSKEARFSMDDANNIMPALMLPSILSGPQSKPSPSLHKPPYKPSSRCVRDVLGGVRAPYNNQHNNNMTYQYAGPAARKSRATRQWIRYGCMETRRGTLMTPNPAATVPMRARPGTKMTWLPKEPVNHENWRIEADREKQRRDVNKANQLGYETLVGNLVYYEIPGSKDLNRSWKHFLNREDPMAWGFPYTKGSTERPSLPLPTPYLVHQLKENLWKYPKNKFLKATND